MWVAAQKEAQKTEMVDSAPADILEVQMKEAFDTMEALLAPTNQEEATLEIGNFKPDHNKPMEDIKLTAGIRPWKWKLSLTSLTTEQTRNAIRSICRWSLKSREAAGSYMDVQRHVERQCDKKLWTNFLTVAPPGRGGGKGRGKGKKSKGKGSSKGKE